MLILRKYWLLIVQFRVKNDFSISILEVGFIAKFAIEKVSCFGVKSAAPIWKYPTVVIDVAIDIWVTFCQNSEWQIVEKHFIMAVVVLSSSMSASEVKLNLQIPTL